jgi:hypothetical protein
MLIRCRCFEPRGFFALKGKPPKGFQLSLLLREFSIYSQLQIAITITAFASTFELGVPGNADRLDHSLRSTHPDDPP